MGHDAAMGWSPLARRTAAVLAWALSTLLAATVAWWAVGTVGRGPGGNEGSVRSQTDVAAELVAARAVQAATSSPTRSASPTPSPTPTPTTGPSATPTVAPPPRTPQPVLADIARTWTVEGGQVSASCRGQQITLIYATPQDGWGVETKNAGPDELLVEFGRSDSETSVRAWCVEGTPQMEVVAERDGARSGDD